MNEEQLKFWENKFSVNPGRRNAGFKPMLEYKLYGLTAAQSAGALESIDCISVEE